MDRLPAPTALFRLSYDDEETEDPLVRIPDSFQAGEGPPLFSSFRSEERYADPTVGAACDAFKSDCSHNKSQLRSCQ